MKAGVGKRYRHYKGGEYTVLTIGRLESNPETTCVVYQSEYDTEDFPTGTVWIREQRDFESMVEVGGKILQRFTQIN